MRGGGEREREGGRKRERKGWRERKRERGRKREREGEKYINIFLNTHESEDGKMQHNRKRMNK